MKSANDYLANLKWAKQQFKTRLMTIATTHNYENKMKRLLVYLDEHGFFIMPASANYHLNVEGGLLVHSLMVDDLLLDWKERYDIPLTHEEIHLTALLHDVCKIYMYGKVYENNRWVWRCVNSLQASIVTEDNRTRPIKLHGHQSTDTISQFLNLPIKIRDMIQWHMGPFSEYYEAEPGEFLKWCQDRNNDIKNAALLLYFADHLSTIIEG